MVLNVRLPGNENLPKARRNLWTSLFFQKTVFEKSIRVTDFWCLASTLPQWSRTCGYHDSEKYSSKFQMQMTRVAQFGRFCLLSSVIMTSLILCSLPSGAAATLGNKRKYNDVIMTSRFYHVTTSSSLLSIDNRQQTADSRQQTGDQSAPADFIIRDSYIYWFSKTHHRQATWSTNHQAKLHGTHD